ncbi:hypothetical protein HDU83_005900 [Entophlyctis luteolus]|nr:hypothetical protein HDU82_005208 [Entophlyctis luteolus]KAJ3354083.1 hypothetical protein HDU83_005900 [Entophlyctis luteolus]KAJ3392194.1 hypothetical protein HDU84_004686 [Entophlyctis sp. JEL0112]
MGSASAAELAAAAAAGAPASVPAPPDTRSRKQPPTLRSRANPQSVPALPDLVRGDKVSSAAKRSSSSSSASSASSSPPNSSSVPALVAPAFPLAKRQRTSASTNVSSQSDRNHASTTQLSSADSRTPQESTASTAATATNSITNDDSGEEVRCVCNQSDDDYGGLWVQCDQCYVWQHCACVGLSGKKLPKNYYCELCRPGDHPYLKMLAKQQTSKQTQALSSAKVSPPAKRRNTLNSMETYESFPFLDNSESSGASTVKPEPDDELATSVSVSTDKGINKVPVKTSGSSGRKRNREALNSCELDEPKKNSSRKSKTVLVSNSKGDSRSSNSSRSKFKGKNPESSFDTTDNQDDKPVRESSLADKDSTDNSSSTNDLTEYIIEEQEKPEPVPFVLPPNNSRPAKTKNSGKATLCPPSPTSLANTSSDGDQIFATSKNSRSTQNGRLSSLQDIKKRVNQLSRYVETLELSIFGGVEKGSSCSCAYYLENRPTNGNRNPSDDSVGVSRASLMTPPLSAESHEEMHVENSVKLGYCAHCDVGFEGTESSFSILARLRKRLNDFNSTY